jgi:hypothetical protein
MIDMRPGLRLSVITKSAADVGLDPGEGGYLPRGAPPSLLRWEIAASLHASQ